MSYVAKLGTPNRFLKGVADVTIFRYGTGDVLAVDTVPTEASVSVPMNYEDVAGGFGNGLAGVIPDSLRLTGKISSNAYSLVERALSFGNEVKNVTSAQLTMVAITSSNAGIIDMTGKAVADSPMGFGKVAYVRKTGTTVYDGTAYKVDSSMKHLQDASGDHVFDVSTSYDVFYFTTAYGAETLDIPGIANLPAVSVQIKYGVYEMTDHVKSHGTFAGWQYAFIPLAIFETDAGTTGNQTSVSGTEVTWTAISPRLNGINILSCDNKGTLGTYAFIPCDGFGNAVSSLAIDESVLVSGTPDYLLLNLNESAPFPVLFVMDDGDVVAPTDLSVFQYSSTGDHITVNANGIIQGDATGSSGGPDNTATATYTKPDGTVLTVTVDVWVKN